MIALLYFFFFIDPPTTEIYTLSLHDALPILLGSVIFLGLMRWPGRRWGVLQDRKSTRLNSSHRTISYAVFCLKKKKSGTRVVVLPTVPFGVNTGQLYIKLCINMNPSTQALVL